MPHAPDPELVLARLRAYQAQPFAHPLTCANDSRGHRPLEPVREDQKVVLVCLDCNYRQTTLPQFALRR
jgi:hypothetical protein